MVTVHQPRMKVFALGLDENQKAAAAEEKQAAALETKIPIDSPIPPQQQTPAIVIAKRPKVVAGFGCGLLSWFIGAFCLVLLCLAISEVAYHRQRDQAFLRLKWAELRQRMLGYELLSQQQEIDRMSMEKQQAQVETLPLRLSKDPIKPQIIDIIQPENDAIKKEDNQEQINIPTETNYSIDQNGKLGFLRDLMDKIRKHAESMGLSGDMQVHVVEVKPIGGQEDGEERKEISGEENTPFDQAIADGFGEFAAPHQDFSDDGETELDGRRTFDRHSMKRPFFGPFNRWEFNDYEDQQQQQQPRIFDGIPSRLFFPSQSELFQPPPLPNQFFFQPQPFFWQQPQQQQQQQAFFQPQQQSQHYWWPQQQQNDPIQTNQWNWPQQQQQAQVRPWYMPEQQSKFQQQQPAWFGPQNDDWMIQKHQEQQAPSPFQPNPIASTFQQPQQTWVDQTAQQASDVNPPKSTVISGDNLGPQQEMKGEKSWIQPHDDSPTEIVTSPDADLEQIDDNKFLPIRSDDKPIDDLNDSPPSSDSHLFQIDDPSSFKR
ncbi:unnamed protein product [Caenorhabditis angaria]|uniref:Uncharacterized protein n=1 Tax=Caenorhabditis angaria TaxID=860376 RepID=A0A9P1IAC6_9PELO|nr:unnamed protein product [Caenorhabditis angaria]